MIPTEKLIDMTSKVYFVIGWLHTKIIGGTNLLTYAGEVVVTRRFDIPLGNIKRLKIGKRRL